MKISFRLLQWTECSLLRTIPKKRERPGVLERQVNKGVIGKSFMRVIRKHEDGFFWECPEQGESSAVS